MHIHRESLCKLCKCGHNCPCNQSRQSNNNNRKNKLKAPPEPRRQLDTHASVSSTMYETKHIHVEIRYRKRWIHTKKTLDRYAGVPWSTSLNRSTVYVLTVNDCIIIQYDIILNQTAPLCSIVNKDEINDWSKSTSGNKGTSSLLKTRSTSRRKRSWDSTSLIHTSPW